MEDEFIESMVLFMQEAGINAEAQFVEVAIRTQMARCGIGLEGTQVGWRRALPRRNLPTVLVV